MPQADLRMQMDIDTIFDRIEKSLTKYNQEEKEMFMLVLLFNILIKSAPLNKTDFDMMINKLYEDAILARVELEKNSKK